ncbi:MAG: hydrogenase small subunit, partial [bacterium]|nr:hydrogenase small subunit [bacterium]MDW8163963.1 hydrogenase small subunit [Candidatus Omnitrophota bacterium]
PSIKIKNLLLDELVPGKIVSLIFQPTIMAGSGQKVIEVLKDESIKGDYLLVVEGVIPTGNDGVYGKVGEKTFLEILLTLSQNAKKIICIGSCSSFGGIPKASPNPTDCKSVIEILKEKNIKKDIINIPGCPPHPDWFLGTITKIIISNKVILDELNRPVDFYGVLIHENCLRRPYFDKGAFAKNFSEEGCLYFLGCKGPFTYADCPIREWNGGINWCIKNNSPCLGCTEPEFLEKNSPLFKRKEIEKLEMGK